MTALANPALRLGWIASSQLAAMTCSLAASVWLLAATGSTLLSALVFGGQWLGAAFYPGAAARLSRLMPPAWLAAAVDASGSLLVVVGALAIASGSSGAAVLVAVVLVKGYTDSVGRTANTLVARERAATRAQVGRAISRMEFARLAGSTSAGVSFAVLGEALPVVPLVLCCATVHAVVALGLWQDRNALPATGSLRRTFATAANESPVEVRLRHIWAMSGPQRTALLQLGLVAAFQGMHNALRTVYPIERLHQGLAGVGIVSAVATAGVFAGGGLAAHRRVLTALMRHGAPLGVVVIAGLVTAATSITDPILSYAGYFLFLAAFEAAFMGINARFVALLDDQESALYLGLRSSALGISALIGLGLTTAALGGLSVPWAVAVICLILTIVSVLGARSSASKELI